MNIIFPDVNVMIREVEAYILQKTGRKIHIVFNNPFELNRHIEMLKDAYKMIKKDEKGQ